MTMFTAPTAQTLITFFRSLTRPGQFEVDASANSREAGLLFVEHWLETPGLDLSGLSAQEQAALFTSALAHTERRSLDQRSRLPARLLDLGLQPWGAFSWVGSAVEALMQADKGKKTHLSLVKRILNDPARPQDWDAVEVKPGQPLLHALVEASSEPMVAIALEAGADPNRRDAAGTTPLAHASMCETMQCLLNHGAHAAGSGWRRVRAASRSSAREGIAPLKMYGAQLSLELGEAAWDGWGELTQMALTLHQEAQSELMVGLLKLFRDGGRVLTWPSQEGPLRGWPLMTALCAHRLAKELGSDAGVGRPGSEEERVFLGLERIHHDWAHESAPGIPDGVWPALLMWSRRQSPSSHLPPDWMAGQPAQFWQGVLTQLNAWWTGTPAEQVMHDQVLASLSLNLIQIFNTPGAPSAAAFQALLDRWLDAVLVAGQLEARPSLECHVVLAGLSCQSAHRASQKGVAPEDVPVQMERWLGLACSTQTSPKQFETLMAALEALPPGMPVTPSRSASVRQAIHRRFQPNSAKSLRMEAWLLSRVLPEAPVLPRVRL